MPIQNKLNFAGKKALVTGGSKGIGRAIVMELAMLSAQVIFTYRKDDASVKDLARWAREGGYSVQGIRCDSSDPSAYPKLLSSVRKDTDSLDILVNNVGDVIRRSSFEEADDQLWVDAVNLNLLSAVRATKAFLPLLKKAEGAVIINVSSIAGKTGGAGDSLHYGVSKAALNTFTVGLAQEMKGTAIRVVGVMPSITDTDFQKKHSSRERLQRIIEKTPLGRIGRPEEVAEAVAFLASDAASYISGELMLISGGRV